MNEDNQDVIRFRGAPGEFTLDLPSMLVDHAMTLLATSGAVVAPRWLLPTAAAATAAIPACLIPVFKGFEAAEKKWKQDAPDQREGYFATHPNAFCVLDAGAKGAGLFATERVKQVC